MTGVLIGALLAGLAGTPHCLAMCGGFASSCSRPRGGLAAWHAGRLTTYAILGAAAAGVGAALPGPPVVTAVVALMLLAWFALSLAGVVREPHLAVPGLARISARIARHEGLGWRYAFGLATGLLPCGLVYSALSVPVALGRPLAGALAMLAFGAGTIPALSALAVGFRRVLPRSLAARRAVAALVFVAGAWAVGARYGLTPGHRHLPGTESHMQHSGHDAGEK